MLKIIEKREIKGRFKGRGVGSKYKQKPIATRYSLQVEEILREMPDRSDFIRMAVEEKLKESGLL